MSIETEKHLSLNCGISIFLAESSSGKQLQSLESQISHLSAAVAQLLQQQQEDHIDRDTQAQLETLWAKCLR